MRRTGVAFLLGTVFLVLTAFLTLVGAGCSDAPQGGAGTATMATVAEGTTDVSRPQAPTSTSDASAAEGVAAGESAGGNAATYDTGYAVTYDDQDLDDSWSTSASSFITLADGQIRFDGAGATVGGGKVTISEAGTYVVSGRLGDGQIVIDLKEKGMVKLVLNGADLTCLTSAPIYVKNANRTVIVLADGTENIVTDGASYVQDDPDSDEPDAAIFSKDDLTINGSGSLTVRADYNHGIVSKDDLKIVSGSIDVTAVNDGIKGRDCIGIKGGVITVNAGGDGLQANNDVDPSKGYVDIQGGTLAITAGADGVQAETTLRIGAGDLDISTGAGDSGLGADGSVGGGTGGAIGTTSASAKGFKAGGGVFIDGGTITIDSSDDCVHSNGSIKVDGGTLVLTSGDDGMHADATIEVDDGDITITESYEGIESEVVTINGGTIHVTASDDGINVVSVSDASSPGGGRQQGAFTVNENNKLYINGGYLAVDAYGDGIDCNGRIFMTAGMVLVDGPINDGNGALDYLGEFTVSGGCIVAVGSSGMAEAPSESSGQRSLMINLEAAQAAGTLINVQDESGRSLLTFAPAKQFRSIVFCSPDIQDGATYTICLGGSSTGTAVDGLYSGGVYTPGEEYATLTVSGIVTVYGSSGGMMPGGVRPGGNTVPGGMPRRGSIPDTTSTTALSF